ncbi:MAG: class I SAM-dependent methyltransferase family protein [Candidatus Diapherotrites archaeon]
MEALGIEIEKSEAEKVKQILSKKSLLNNSLLPIRKGNKVIFPIKEKPIENLGKIVKTKFSMREKKPKNIKEVLSKSLSKEEIALLPSSFDLLGDCAILELNERIKHKALEIAEALMLVNKQVKSVFLKTGAHHGIFRNEPVVFIAGKRTNKATYIEHGCKFKITLGQVFFSPRLSSERKRISNLIKEGEKIACLFAGVGPFPIVFAKHSKMSMAIAIELNPTAYNDMLENITINKLQNKIIPLLGDVKEFAKMPEYKEKFDRVIMPLPKGGENFLEDAINFLKKEGMIHYYQFSDSKSPFEDPHKQIENACKDKNATFEIIFEKKVRDYAPSIVQVVIDFFVRKR